MTVHAGISILLIVGLGNAASRNGITGLLSGSGYLKIPFLNGVTERTFILQWGAVSNGGSGTTGSATFPIVFPSAIIGGAFGPLDTENGGFSVSFSTRSVSGFTAIFRDVSNAPYPHVPTRLQSSTYFVLGY
ncbi:gp53-like domain-containing protein [Enterobacter cloacae]|uniref:gp53-like domain-containing protein n=1 Tax=Enterobacter cloacae complex TaxID=354276 RepID=UPI003C2EC492